LFPVFFFPDGVASGLAVDVVVVVVVDFFIGRDEDVVAALL